ncbi:MAG: response regulator, partial [Nitrosomonas sp.]|nr:response regulator [Nitrosomonas sp.]
MSDPQEIKINILLIEDENKWINVFKSIIENEEHISLRSARSSGLALELLNDINEINLVVMDYELGTGELTGDYLIGFIRKKRPDISIICWSAYPPTPSKIELIEKLGAIGFISKGVDDKTVLDTLSHVRQNNKFFLRFAPSDVVREFTPIQRTILEQLAEGKDYEAIAKHFLEQDYHNDKNRGNYVGNFEEYLNSSNEQSKLPAKVPFWHPLLPSPLKNPEENKPDESSDEKNSKPRLNGKKKLIENHIQDIKDRIVKYKSMKRKEITFPFLIHFAFDYFSNPKRKFSPEKILGIIFLKCYLEDGKSIEKIAEIYSTDLDSIEKYLSE